MLTGPLGLLMSRPSVLEVRQTSSGKGGDEGKDVTADRSQVERGSREENKPRPVCAGTIRAATCEMLLLTLSGVDWCKLYLTFTTKIY